MKLFFHSSNKLKLFVPEICTLPLLGPGQKVLNDPDPNIVSHLLQLFVDILHALIVPDYLGHQGTIRQAEQLPTHLLCVRDACGGSRHYCTYISQNFLLYFFLLFSKARIPPDCRVNIDIVSAYVSMPMDLTLINKKEVFIWRDGPIK